MFDYLQKFNSLPKELRNQISSPAVMTALSELENKYRVDLAMVVMKMMIKELTLKSLPAYLISEFDLAPSAAENLGRELQDKVLASVAGHLGFIAGKSVISAKNLHKVETVSDKFRADRLKNLALKPEISKERTVPPIISAPSAPSTPSAPSAPSAPSTPSIPSVPQAAAPQKPEKTEKKAVDSQAETAVKAAPAPTPENQAKEQRSLDIEKDINRLIETAGLILPSEAYVSRLKNILTTYLRGIRNKIDTRAALTKDVEIGGLRLSDTEADRIFKVCDSQGCRLPEKNEAIVSRPVPSSLDKIIAQADSRSLDKRPAEYDLKSSLASGQTKPVILDSKHELAAPEKQLDLPRPVPKAASASAVVPASVPATPASSVKIPPLAAVSAVKSPSAPVLTPKQIITPPPVSINRPKGVNSDIKPAVRPKIISRPTPISSPVKPQMHDIKPMPKVMGPIEELQFLDLTNFRRLGKTATEITAKIFAKIKLLEKDGYDKMVAGVHAWRSSPVNRLYIGLGQEAISKGVPIKEAIALRQRAGQACLTMEEIEEIVKLNSRLAF